MNLHSYLIENQLTGKTMSHHQKIRAYIANELAPDTGAEDLPADYELVASGLIDSLALVRLVTWIESEYSIPLGDMNIAPQDFSSIEKINAFIKRSTSTVI